LIRERRRGAGSDAQDHRTDNCCELHDDMFLSSAGGAVRSIVPA
jgi:hypothetical protein